jgi:hypothetical protein
MSHKTAITVVAMLSCFLIFGKFPEMERFFDDHFLARKHQFSAHLSLEPGDPKDAGLYPPYTMPSGLMYRLVTGFHH